MTDSGGLLTYNLAPLLGAVQINKSEDQVKYE